MSSRVGLVKFRNEYQMSLARIGEHVLELSESANVRSMPSGLTLLMIEASMTVGVSQLSFAGSRVENAIVPVLSAPGMASRMR